MLWKCPGTQSRGEHRERSDGGLLCLCLPGFAHEEPLSWVNVTCSPFGAERSPLCSLEEEETEGFPTRNLLHLEHTPEHGMPVPAGEVWQFIYRLSFPSKQTLTDDPR